MKTWLIFLLLMINGACLWSQTKLKHDSAFVASRSFNNNQLTKFKSQPDFQYARLGRPPLSLWDRFWLWFWWKIQQLLNTKSGRITFWSILIILGLAAMISFILKLTGMDQEGLFGRGTRGLQKYSLSQNDIHNISFDEAIAGAINSGNYRLATRLQYLQALKKLSDRGYIDWRINKTNTDYLTETAGRPFYAVFHRLTYDFEYTWYGERQVSKESFSEIRNQFQQFNNQVQ